MRLRINLKLKEINTKDNCLLLTSIVNKILGDNNKWHGVSDKPYSVSMILGGKREGEKTVFKNDSHIFISTTDMEIVAAILGNISGKYDFDIVKPEIRNGVNILHVYDIRYKYDGKNHILDDKNKQRFEDYVLRKFGVKSSVEKVMRCVPIKYKGDVYISTSSILLKVIGDDNNKGVIENMFEKGLGCSTGIGFGFVQNIKTFSNEEFED